MKDGMYIFAQKYSSYTNKAQRELWYWIVHLEWWIFTIFFG